jgi:hypothetical protein
MEMIDEKRLEEYAAMAESSERGFCFGYGRVDREELRAIIRLARLGLWAERELRADVRHYIEEGADFIYWITPGKNGEPMMSHCMRLAALPKERG